MKRARVVACCALAASSAFALFHCGKEATVTELVLVVGTDLNVPRDVDDVTITIDGPNGFHTERDVAVGSGAPSFPLTLGIEASSAGEHVDVAVHARRSGKDVVVRSVTSGFVQNETRMLRVDVCASCVGASCTAGTTCVQGTCIPPTVSADSLPGWTGSVPAGPSCTSVPPGDAASDAPTDGPGSLDAGDAGDGAAPCVPQYYADAGETFEVDTCQTEAAVCKPGEVDHCAIVSLPVRSGGKYQMTTPTPNIGFVPADTLCNPSGSGGGASCPSMDASATAGYFVLICTRSGACGKVPVTFTYPHP